MTAIDATVRGHLRRDVLAYVRKHPACTAEEMAEHFGKMPNVVSTAAKALWEAGVLGRQRDGKPFRYFLPAPSRAGERPESPCEIEFDFDVAPPTDAVDVAALQAEIEALEQWKADAIAKHPDLAPIDPDLLRAREIAAAAMGDEAAAGDIMRGWDDHTPLVQAVLTAIKAG